MRYLKTFENFRGIDHNKLWWDLGLSGGRGTTRQDLEIEEEEELPLDDEEHLPLEDDDSDLPDLEDEPSEKEL